VPPRLVEDRPGGLFPVPGHGLTGPSGRDDLPRRGQRGPGGELRGVMPAGPSRRVSWIRPYGVRFRRAPTRPIHRFAGDPVAFLDLDRCPEGPPEIRHGGSGGDRPGRWSPRRCWAEGQQGFLMPPASASRTWVTTLRWWARRMAFFQGPQTRPWDSLIPVVVMAHRSPVLPAGLRYFRALDLLGLGDGAQDDRVPVE